MLSQVSGRSPSCSIYQCMERSVLVVSVTGSSEIVYKWGTCLIGGSHARRFSIQLRFYSESCAGQKRLLDVPVWPQRSSNQMPSATKHDMIILQRSTMCVSLSFQEHGKSSGSMFMAVLQSCLGQCQDKFVPTFKGGHCMYFCSMSQTHASTWPLSYPG